MRLRFYQTASAEHPAQWTPEREETENAARVDEADAPAELARIAADPVEEPRDPHDRLQRLGAHLGAPRTLVAVEEPDLAGRLHGKAVAAAGLANEVGDIGADPRGLPRDRHADDLRPEPVELLGHEQPGVTPAAERCDHDRVERGSAVPDLLHELLAARDVSERARDRGAALGDDVGRAAARADPRGEVLEQLVDPAPLVVAAEPDLGAEQPVEQQVAVVLLGRRALG